MKRKINKQVLIIGMMLIASLLALLLIHLFDPERENQKLRAEYLEKELLQLESRIVEYQSNYIDQNEEIRLAHMLLGEKHDHLERMNQHVRKLEEDVKKLERAGTTHRKSIKAIQVKLEKAKAKLVGMYEMEINSLVSEMSSLMRENEESELEKAKMSEMLSSIQSLYEDCSKHKLIEENIPAKPSLLQKNPGFVAEQIEIQSISPKGTFSNRKNLIFLKQTQSLRLITQVGYINTDGSESKGEFGQYKLFIQFKHKRLKEVLHNKEQSSSAKKFRPEKREELSSLEVLFNYQGRNLRIQADLQLPGDPQDWPKGVYQALIYLEKEESSYELIGAKEFFVQ
ncbi:MAG: hypothetical protein AAF696_00770 [Bacteroidota bacterium]